MLSCVRAFEQKNRRRTIGFLSSGPRLNVSLTRCRESMIICGHLETLEVDEMWKKMILNAKDRKAVRNVKSNYTSDDLCRLVKRTA